MTGAPADERPDAADDGHPAVIKAGVYFHPMSPGTDNQVDWTAATTPQGDRMAPSLSRQQSKPRVTPQTRRSVMDTLLGENSLAAIDIGGGDPYNATGRQFRR